jgi:hypothetical protein
MNPKTSPTVSLICSSKYHITIFLLIQSTILLKSNIVLSKGNILNDMLCHEYQKIMKVN